MATVQVSSAKFFQSMIIMHIALLFSAVLSAVLLVYLRHSDASAPQELSEETQKSLMIGVAVGAFSLFALSYFLFQRKVQAAAVMNTLPEKRGLIARRPSCRPRWWKCRACWDRSLII